MLPQIIQLTRVNMLRVNPNTFRKSDYHCPTSATNVPKHSKSIDHREHESSPHESTMAAQHFALRMFISFERRSINDGSSPVLNQEHLLYPPAITVSIISANQCTPTLCHRFCEPPRGVTKLIFVRIQTDLLNVNFSRSPQPSFLSNPLSPQRSRLQRRSLFTQCTRLFASLCTDSAPLSPLREFDKATLIGAFG